MNDHSQKDSSRKDPLDRLVADSAERSFAPHFAGRVMDRLPGLEANDERFAALLWARFQRVAVAASIAAAGLAAYNTAQTADAGYAASAVESVLALPPLTLDAAFDLDADASTTAPDS